MSVLLLGFTHMSFVAASNSVMMFGNFEDFAGIHIFYVSLVLMGIYALSVMLFIGLGQETGRLTIASRCASRALALESSRGSLWARICSSTNQIGSGTSTAP